MRTRVAILLLACMFVLNCGTAPTRPRPVDVRLSLDVSAEEGSALKPITFTAVARNMGGRTVYYAVGCGCDPIAFWLIGPDGGPVAYADPCLPLPLCPCGPVALAPGMTVDGSLRFSGDVYGPPSVLGGPCLHEGARSGDYTVIARYGFTVDGEYGTREQRATFHWSGTDGMTTNSRPIVR